MPCHLIAKIKDLWLRRCFSSFFKLIELKKFFSIWLCMAYFLTHIVQLLIKAPCHDDLLPAANDYQSHKNHWNQRDHESMLFQPTAPHAATIVKRILSGAFSLTFRLHGVDVSPSRIIDKDLKVIRIFIVIITYYLFFFRFERQTFYIVTNNELSWCFYYCSLQYLLISRQTKPKRAHTLHYKAN